MPNENGDMDTLSRFVNRGLSAQRAVDSVIQKIGEASTKNKARKSRPSRRNLKKKRNLTNGLDVHWRTGVIGYESIMREVYDEFGDGEHLSKAERKRWFKRGWEKRLEERRERQRKAGVPDSKFQHPSLRGR